VLRYLFAALALPLFASLALAGVTSKPDPVQGKILAEKVWGKGDGVEAMQAAIAWFEREHGQQRIACMIEDGHPASARVAEKLGFVRYDRTQQPDQRPLGLWERG